MSDDDTPWYCARCGQRFPVPILARDCETAHLDHTEHADHHDATGEGDT